MSLSIADGVMLRACLISGFSPEALRARCRARKLVRVRQAMMLVLAERTSWSYPHIGGYLCIADHTTVRHGRKTAQDRVAVDPEFATLVAALRAAEAIPPLTLAARLAEADVTLITAEELGLTPGRPRSGNFGTTTRPDSPKRAEPKTPKPKPRPSKAKAAGKGLRRDSSTKFEAHFIEAISRSIHLNQDGDTPDNVAARRAIIAGSRGLALSILTARAGAQIGAAL